MAWSGEVAEEKGRSVLNLHVQSQHWPKGSVKLEAIQLFSMEVEEGDTMFSIHTESEIKPLQPPSVHERLLLVTLPEKALSLYCPASRFGEVIPMIYQAYVRVIPFSKQAEPPLLGIYRRLSSRSTGIWGSCHAEPRCRRPQTVGSLDGETGI